MAVAWIEAGGRWGIVQEIKGALSRDGYDVVEWRAGGTDPETGRLRSVLDITGSGEVAREFQTSSWRTRD